MAVINISPKQLTALFKQAQVLLKALKATVFTLHKYTGVLYNKWFGLNVDDDLCLYIQTKM